MKYKLLGNSGLRVSELCLGTRTFGNRSSLGAEDAESRQIFEAFMEAGGNFIDTANAYGEGNSEKLVGEFVRAERDRFVIATKYSFALRQGDPNAGGNHRKSLRSAVEGSLERINTDYIDLLWLHAWDSLTPIEEVMRSLDDMVRSGKVLYLGISDSPAWIAAQANTLARCYGWTPFVALQGEYSLVERSLERELLPMARAFDLAVLTWSPLGSGVLTGKYNSDSPDSGRYSESSEIPPRQLEIASVVVKIAEELGKAPSQVALAWLRAQPGVIIPLIGARKAYQVQENLGCVDVALSHDHLQRLEQVSQIELGFPHDFLALNGIKKLLTGDTFDNLIV
ncbi:MAG: aldo/keto reductase [Cyanophyceae cyanobacterium]